MPHAYQRTHVEGFDPDRLRHVLNGGRVETVLLKPAVSEARAVHWQEDDLAVDRGRYGFDVLARAEFRPGFLGIGLSSGAVGDVRINGIELREDQLQVHPEGSELLYRAGAGTTWTMIQVRREELQRRAEEQLGRGLVLPERHVVNMEAHAHELVELNLVVRSLLTELGDAQGAETEARRRDVLVDSIVEALGNLSSPPSAERRALNAHYRTRTVLEAQRLLRSRLDEPYDSARLCRELGYSERTLELYFRQTLQVSPQNWHRKARMHCARALLLQARAAGRSVSDVALRCGFDQLGRFSVEYRRLFGEKPSETWRGRAVEKARN